MANSPNARRSILYAALCFMFSVSGCGYKLQTKTSLPFDSIAIGRIENQTTEPKLQDRMQKLLAETLMEYGFSISPSATRRIDGSITKFTLTALSEKDLTASEYEVAILGDFRLADTEKGSTTVLFGNSPFITYFSTAGPLENLTAQKETATNNALKNISEELVRRIVYNSPSPAVSNAGTKK